MNKSPAFLETLKENKYVKFIRQFPVVEYVDDVWIIKKLKLKQPLLEKTLIDKYEFDRAKNVCEFKKLKIENIEFHDCDLVWSQWVLCSFKNVKFFNCKIRNAKFWNPKMENVEFHKVSFVDTIMGADLDGSSGEYSKTIFIDCDLNRSKYVCPVFKNCLFKDCNFDQVHTNGSDFNNVRFEGYIKMIIFYDNYRWRPNTVINFLLAKRKTKDNLYSKVDFSNAKFGDVGFKGGVNLSEITLPDDKDILIVENALDVFLNMKAVIEKEWSGENRRIALNGINMYLEQINEGKRNFMFLKHIDYEVLGEDYADKFYKLLESIIH